MIGQTLAHYEVTGSLGKGGMGEVWRARDTKLEREVAIKTLPSEFANDMERLARFAREAKLLAALNHAHIASIYGLDEYEGTQFLAMELVEGQTLDERLKEGPISVDDALRYGLQIAEALEAAHYKGVIHRDLKPANIMVTPEGAIKVLDFGLAKAFTGDPAAASPAHSPALSAAMTQQGLILGTAGYMSPEQASGQATDQRADVWAFGVVMFEMLSGLPLFTGESVPHILAGILRTDPEWEQLPKDLDPRIRTLLERCLEKQTRNRYHGIADARVDIERVLNDPQGAEQQSGIQAAASTRVLTTPLAAAVALTAIAMVLVGWMLWPEPGAAPIDRFVHTVAAPDTLRNTALSALTISPDGRHFVYNASSGLHLRRMDEVEARALSGTQQPMTGVTMSPDGGSIAFYDGQIRRMSTSGGAAVAVTGPLSVPRGISWAADDSIWFGGTLGIYRVSATGGEPELEIAAREDERLVAPQLLPDGENVLFSVLGLGVERDAGQVAVESLSTGERTVVLSGGSTARYVPTGHLLYPFESDLFGIAFEANSLSVSGGAVPLLEGVMRSNPNSPIAQFDIAEDGTLVYAVEKEEDEGGRRLVWVGRDGQEAPSGLEPRNYTYVRISEDGRRIAATISDQGGADVWVADVSRPVLSRITNTPDGENWPLWTPDSRRVVFRTNAPDGGAAIGWTLADSTGDIEILTTEGGGLMAAGSWTPDDRTFTFTHGTSGDPRIGMLTVDHDDPDHEPVYQPFIRRETGASALTISPTGDWMAYHADDTGQWAVYIERFPQLGDRTPVSDAQGGWGAIWSPDGSELFYRRLGDGAMMAVQVETSPDLSMGLPEMLFEGDNYAPVTTPPPDGGSPRVWDLAPDGRFLMIKERNALASADTIVVVQNWFEELKRLVPTE